MSVSPHLDEYTITTLGFDNMVKTHKIKQVRQKYNETIEVTSRNGTKRNQTLIKYNYEFSIELESEFNLQENLMDQAQITAYSMYMIRGIKFHIFGDNLGYVYVFQKNGTFKEKSQFSNTPIISILKHYTATLVASQNKIGFYNPLSSSMPQEQNQQQNSDTICEKPTDQIIGIELEQVNTNIFYILLKNQEILVYDMKPSQNQCRVFMKFNSAYSRQHQTDLEPAQIYSIRNFLLFKKDAVNKLQIYNTTDIESENHSDEEAFNVILHKQQLVNYSQEIGFSNESDMIYSFQKINQLSTYIVAIENIPGQNESSVNIYEMIQQQKPQNEFLSNLRFPVILISIVFAIGYQMWSRKKGDSKMTFEEFEKIEKEAKDFDFSKGKSKKFD